jgi:hypothetical protein
MTVVFSTAFSEPLIWNTLARSAGCVRSLHHLLQPLRSLAAGRRVGRIIDAFAVAHDAAVQMIDTSIVRVHQHGARTAEQKTVDGDSHGAG